MTFSLAARCPQTGQFGVVVTSSSPAVAARCAYVRANVGAVCTQNITDPRLGPRLLDLMEQGISAQIAMGKVVAEEELIQFRQLTAIDSNGETAAFSGGRTLGRYHIAEGENAVAAGNLLALPEVPAAMLEAFAETDDQALELGGRLVLALKAGLRAGGEEGPVRSAGMLLAGYVPWPIADLRVDWSDDPIAELGQLWNIWQPQMDDYIVRALNPIGAPSYGVPGDPETI
jgi:uncharacterized Ntn-hydrolase superfamily protein